MGFEVSRTTANKIKNLLRKGDKGGAPSTNGGGTAKYDAFILVTGAETSGGFFPCVVTEWDASAGSWNDYDGSCLAFDVNNFALSSGNRYRAMHVGSSGDVLIFGAEAAALDEHNIGCGLTIDDGKLAVDVSGLAGDGLEAVPANQPGCNGRCHWIWIGADGPGGEATWSMDADTTDCTCTCWVYPDYDGTTPGETAVTQCGTASGDCDALHVKEGCGIDVGADGVSVDVASLAGDGLKVQDGDSGDCPPLAINHQCGLLIDEDGKLALDVESVFTGCFIAQNNEGGCPDVSVDVSRAFFSDIPFLQDVSVSIAGCSGTVTKTPRILRVWENGCGMLTGAVVLSAEATTTTFSIGCCCDSDSGSGAFAPQSMTFAPMALPVQTQPEEDMRTYLINLKRRPERLAASLAECNKAGLSPIVFEAVDGHVLPLPKGWEAGPGAFGCQQSHLAVLRQAIQDGIDTVMVLEDDVVFVDGFKDKYAEFMRKVPSDWDAVFLGGQEMEPSAKTDVEGVMKAKNVHRTHCYVIRGAYLKHMFATWQNEAGHVDHVWGKHQKEWRVYHPATWLAGQREGMSDIKGRELPQRYWDSKRRAVQKARPLRAAKPCACKGDK